MISIMVIATMICGMVSIIFSGMIAVDKYFMDKEERERLDRKARQAYYARLYGEKE